MRAWSFRVLVGLMMVFSVGVGAARAQGNGGMPGQTEAQAVDSIFGYVSSLEVDSQGRPHISFVESRGVLGYRLRHATEPEPGLWWFETLTDWGGPVAHVLALDAAGNPHIVFWQAPGPLMYVAKVSDHWHFETMNPDSINASAISVIDDDPMALQIDHEGNPHFVTLSWPSGIHYYHRSEQGWQESVASLPDLQSMDDSSLSLALDRNTNPHIAVNTLHSCCDDWAWTFLHYLYVDGNEWHVEEIQTQGGGIDPSIIVDAAGRVHFTFLDGGCWGPEPNTPCGFFYSIRSTAAPATGLWQTEAVDPERRGAHQLLVDEQGQPHISYSVHAFSNFYNRTYFYKTETGWQQQDMQKNDPFGPCISNDYWGWDSFGRPVLACVSEGMELIMWSATPTYPLWLPLVNR